MDIKSFDLRSRLAADAGENSIMQTITIAVSAILIAAGLVTAPGLINNARDNNARTDLANIAFSQEFVLANNGEYAANIVDLLAEEPTAADIENGQSGPRLTLSAGTASVEVTGDADSYVAVALSASGKVFARSSANGTTVLLGTDLAAVAALDAAGLTATGLDVDGVTLAAIQAAAAGLTTP